MLEWRAVCAERCTYGSGRRSREIAKDYALLLTLLPTQDGWLYLAVVVDLFSRKIVGWALASTMETSLVAIALTMAIGRRHPPPGLLHHSDRGSQYASEAYQALLQRHQMVGSMSRRGNCWDNAVVERVFRSVKHEGLDDTAKKQPAETVKATVIDYMEMFYNSHRLHTTLGYLSPNVFEAQAQGRTPQLGGTQGGIYGMAYEEIVQ